ncbi:hypothetical protein NLI96_g8045 [Meripilus lineatus]|uniref:Glycine cleavage system H protein n=1 Tax=Meripilus lineatus TaxID=2056292 RepID=A0AAD5YBH2_9APHY|nr:hypothetical protein NLI96_g8045 [Physisporinus lineatus]
MLNAFRHASRSTGVLRVARRAAPVNAPRITPFVRTVVTKRYTEDHEAVVYDDATNVGVVSITDYAQSSLGDVVFVELPVVGSEYAPISGKVEEVNEELNSQPGLLNKSPEDAGWLCKIKVSDASEIDNLMTEDAYAKHCES